MARPFAVAGFTVFFTIVLLFGCETGVTKAVLICSTVALVIALFLEKLRRIKQIPVTLVSISLSCLLLVVSTNFLYLPLVSYDGQTHYMKARLTGDVEEEYGNYYYNAESFEIGGEEVEADVRLVFNFPLEAEAYDCVEGNFVFYKRGKTSEIAQSSNKASGMVLGAYPSGDISVTLIKPEDKPFGYKLIRYRYAIEDAVYKALPDERGALAVAMLLGDKSGIPSDIYKDIRMVGLAHTVCVSGLHLSLWSNLILVLLRKTRLNHKLSSLIAAAGVVAFMAIAGFTYSVVRAGIMMLIYLLSDVTSRKSDSLNSLGIALIVMACINPFSMGSLALELSVLSTAGVILHSLYISPKVTDFLNRRLTNKIILKPALWFYESFGSTVCASLMTIPLIYNFSCSVSLYVLVTNIVILPFVGICMVLCALGAIWASVFGSGFNLFAFAGGIIIDLIIGYSDSFSAIDILNLRMEPDKAQIIFCGVMFFAIVALVLGFRGKGKAVLSTFLAFSILIVSSVAVSYSERRETRIEVIDTGNGVSVLFTHNGENILVNCGGSDFFTGSNISRAIDTCYGKIDCLILTDTSEYAASEAVDIIKEYTPQTLMCGETGREISQVSGKAVQVDICGTYKSKNFVAYGEKSESGPYIIIETNDITAAVCAHPVRSAPQADILITRSDYPQNAADIGYDFVAVCAENHRGVLIQNELTGKQIRAAATAGNGNIIMRAYNGEISSYRKDG